MPYRLILLFFCFTTGLHATAQTNAVNWKSSVNSIDHYTFFYPATWKFREAGEGKLMAVFSPQDSTNDYFAENINLSVKPFPKGVDSMEFEAILSYVKSAMESKFEQFKFLYHKTIQLNQYQGIEFCYEGSQTSNGQLYHLKFVQRMLVKDRMLYTITYTGLAETADATFQMAISIMNRLQ